MRLNDRVNILRECSKVERAHTLPHHGSYTNGQHQYDAVMLLFELYPGEPSMNLVKAVLTHDLGERWCGDVPAPAKWSDGEFAKRIDLLEQRCRRALGYDIPLTPDEQNWLKAVDTVELLLWAKEQIAMGNTNAAIVVHNIVEWLKKGGQKLPAEALDFVKEHQHYRTPDHLPK